MIFGNVTFRIGPVSPGKVYRYIIKNRFPVRKLQEEDEFITVTLPIGSCREITDNLKRDGINYEIVSEKGAVFILKKAFQKKGILLGIIVTLILTSVFSHRILSFEILTDNTEIKRDVLAVLYEQGIKAGKYIPDLNLTVAERALKRDIDEISWAGISVRGCKIIVDVLDNINKPEYREKRLPTDLIASENAVIEKIELQDGRLLKPVGSGVLKGDIIVSGKMITEKEFYKKGEKRIGIYTKYTRSTGNIYGTFERHECFFQPYYTEKKTDLKTYKRPYIEIFNSKIILFGGENNSSISYDPDNGFPSFLPISFGSVELADQTYIRTPVSPEEAEKLANQKMKLYETNFLKDYEIRSSKTTVEHGSDGVTLTVIYELYGVISKEVEFFMPKTKNYVEYIEKVIAN